MTEAGYEATRYRATALPLLSIMTILLMLPASAPASAEPAPCFHPADSNWDWHISLDELKAYALSMTCGSADSPDPDSLALSSLAQAVCIWSGGGEYFDAGARAPQRWQTVLPSPAILRYPDSGTFICIRAGSELDIVLAGNATTGFMWDVVTCDETVLERSGESYAVDDLELEGSSGVHTFRFEAIAPGGTAVELDYRRSGNPDAPADSFRVDVTVLQDSGGED